MKKRKSSFSSAPGSQEMLGPGKENKWFLRKTGFNWEAKAVYLSLAMGNALGFEEGGEGDMSMTTPSLFPCYKRMRPGGRDMSINLFSIYIYIKYGPIYVCTHVPYVYKKEYLFLFLFVLKILRTYSMPKGKLKY